jgi:hypothetical protein
LPLSERTRIEVYLPDVPNSAYQKLLRELESEFTHTFGGATVANGLDGNYLSRLGVHIRDRIAVLYSDIPLSLREQFELVSKYADHLRDVAFGALQEEAVLIVAIPAFHATQQ